MNKKINIENLIEALNEKYAIWEDLQRNEDKLYYKGMLQTLEHLGLSWDRKNGIHTIW